MDKKDKKIESIFNLIQEKYPEIKFRVTPSLDDFIVDFLRKYQVNINLTALQNQSNKDQTKINEWIQWKQWALDHKDFEAYKLNNIDKVNEHNERTIEKLKSPSFQEELQNLIEEQSKEKKINSLTIKKYFLAESIKEYKDFKSGNYKDKSNEEKQLDDLKEKLFWNENLEISELPDSLKRNIIDTNFKKDESPNSSKRIIIDANLEKDQLQDSFIKFIKNKNSEKEQSSNSLKEYFKSKNSEKEQSSNSLKEYFQSNQDDQDQDLIHNAYIARNVVCAILFLLLILAVFGNFGTTISFIATFILLMIPLCFEATRKAIGLFNVVLGVIFTITGVGALLGIPMILFGFLAFFWKDNDRD